MNDELFPAPDKPVLVIGAAGMDIVGLLKGDLHPGTSNPAQIRSSFGGVARNVAENIARLGQPVELITAVGDDPTGEQLLQQIAAAGVGISAVIHSTEYRTGSYLAVVNTNEQLQVALDDMRAISALSAEYLRDKRVLLRAGFLTLSRCQFVERNAAHRLLAGASLPPARMR